MKGKWKEESKKRKWGKKWEENRENGKKMGVNNNKIKNLKIIINKLNVTNLGVYNDINKEIIVNFLSTKCSGEDR